jgi:Tol biopolymer transport system component
MMSQRKYVFNNKAGKMKRTAWLTAAIMASLSISVFGFGSVKGMIVYSAIEEHNKGSFIYAISPDGKVKKELTTGENLDIWPAVSPDGSQVAFCSSINFNYRIFVMDADGGNIRQVAGTEHDAVLPSWSPDGKLIAFWDRESDHTTRLYLVKPDGTGLRAIVTGAKHDDDYQYPPEWTPDGKHIIYDRKDMGSKNDTFPACLYIVNVDGRRDRPLGAHERTCIDAGISPDGKKVIYYSQKEKFDYNRSDNAGIFIMGMDAAGEKFLTQGFRPVWSPDGSLIAYTGSNDNVWIMFPNGKGPGNPDPDYPDGEANIPLQMSVDDSPGVKDPVWSPDSKHIAFVTDRGDYAKNELIVADIEGNTPIVLSNNVIGRSRPSWR